MKQITKLLNFGILILIGAAIVQGIQYRDAFLLVHNTAGIYASVGGVMAGIVVVGAVAFGASRIPRIKAKQAQAWAKVFFFLLIAITPFILTPVNWYTMQAGLRLSIGWYSWVLSACMALVADGALALVAFSIDGGLLKEPKTVDEPKTQDAQPATTDKPQPKVKAAKVAKRPVTDAQLVDYTTRNPGATVTQVAQHFGISHQAAGKRLRKLYNVTSEVSQ